MTTNHLNRSARLANGHQHISEALKALNEHYDLSPLAKFLNMEGQIYLEDLYGRQEDFAGSDLKIHLHGEPQNILVSDKYREDGRPDLGFEIVRLYEWKRKSPFGDFYVVYSGGRDLIRIPTHAINAEICDKEFMAADHCEETKSDLILLRTDVREPVFIKTNVAKKIAKTMMERCKDKFTEIMPEAWSAIDGTQCTLTKTIDAPSGVDIKCLADFDTKTVKFNGVMRTCRIGKIIAYIDVEECLIENVDYIVVHPKESNDE